MAGIYIHVPFCKTRCIYCDFFTRTNTVLKSPYVDALCKEISLRKDYLNEEESINTIYFGGGTPSQLNEKELSNILNSIKDNFEINHDAEITLEANPDDLTPAYLDMLIRLGFNRLSMGVQSFDDNMLKFLNRRHSAQRAIEAVQMSQKAGFSNISIDLMYGLPEQDMPLWKTSIDQAIELNIQHISAYHLIYEKGTKLYRLQEKGNVKAIDEDISHDMFAVLIEKLNEAGFMHYEISNFAKDSLISQHNSSYWLGANYLGLGPAAHSYNTQNRSWNISSIPKYIDAINNNSPSVEIEELDLKTRYNDLVLTGLRTMWGVNKETLKVEFGDNLRHYFERNIQKYIESKDVLFDSISYKIAPKGIFISDSIMSDLMYID